MARRSKRQEGGGAPEWMTTFSDMMTLLLTFFVLLYSFSSIDAGKFKAFLASFQGQGILSHGEVPFEEISPDADINPSDDPLANESSSIISMNASTAQTLEKVQNFIEEMGLEAEVSVRVEEPGVAINIKDRILFDSGKADLKEEAKTVLDPLAKLFSTIKEEIWVEGHTDNRPIHTKEYPTNWELSTARSSRVIRYFVENKKLEPTQFVAVGFAEYHPVAPNNSLENMQQNRRVVMIIRTADQYDTEVDSNE